MILDNNNYSILDVLSDPNICLERQNRNENSRVYAITLENGEERLVTVLASEITSLNRFLSIFGYGPLNQIVSLNIDNIAQSLISKRDELVFSIEKHDNCDLIKQRIAGIAARAFQKDENLSGLDKLDIISDRGTLNTSAYFYGLKDSYLMKRTKLAIRFIDFRESDASDDQKIVIENFFTWCKNNNNWHKNNWFNDCLGQKLVTEEIVDSFENIDLNKVDNVFISAVQDRCKVKEGMWNDAILVRHFNAQNYHCKIVG